MKLRLLKRGQRLAVKVAGVSLNFRWAVLGRRGDAGFCRTGRRAARRRAGALGGTITAVQIQGNVRAEAETIRSYLQLKEGQPYDPAAADRSLKALFATGLFSDVVIDMQGSTLVVKVTENPIINRVAFEGNKKIEDDKLRDEVQSKPRQVFTRARVQSDVERHPHDLSSQRPLQRRRSSPRSSSSTRAASIWCSRSTRATSPASSASASSATSISATAPCAARSRPPRAPGGASCRRTTASIPTGSNLDRELLRKFYLSEGYADFRVVSAVAELAPDRDGFFITFTINEGERYKFGKVEVTTRFQGLDADTLQELPDDERGRLVRRRRGREDRDGDGRRSRHAGLCLRRCPPQHPAQQGHAHRRPDLRHPGGPAGLCRAHQHLRQHPHPGQGDPPRVPPRRGRRLLDRQGAPQPAAPARTSASSRRSISRRRPARRRTRPISKSRWSSRAPAKSPSAPAISTTSGILGDISIRERNLLGKGQDLRLGLSLGTLSTLIDLSFTEPYFLDRPMAAGFDIFRTSNDRQNVASYSDRSIGFALRSRLGLHRAHPPERALYLAPDRTSTTFSPGPRRSSSGRPASSVVSEVSETIAWDTRDTRLNTTKGWLLRNTLAVAGLGGTQRLTWPLGERSDGRHRPHHRHGGLHPDRLERVQPGVPGGRRQSGSSTC